ncbi:GL16354 [Drosophila persimilis]|uniref:GL16354 n=1 Tax=Drosophila persimilis TaxID=7234 RepID=B4GQN7_DROPE|nr:GL16354 [Drosophila persimilis]
MELDTERGEGKVLAEDDTTDAAAASAARFWQGPGILSKLKVRNALAAAAATATPIETALLLNVPKRWPSRRSSRCERRSCYWSRASPSPSPSLRRNSRQHSPSIADTPQKSPAPRWVLYERPAWTAKYFGVQETFKSTTTAIKTQSMPPRIVTKAEATNEHVRQPGTTFLTQKRREMLKRMRPISLDTYTSSSISPTAMPSPKRAHSPSNRAKATISSFEDIEVTPQELNAAGKDFKRLCVEILD